MIVIKNEQQVIGAYEKLPPKIQEAIDAISNLEIIQKISRKYKLSGDDGETLEMFTGFTLLGFIRPKNLLDEVAPILEVKEQTLVEILKEINREIFLPLHDDFQVLYQSQTSSWETNEEEQETNLRIKIFEGGRNEKKSSTETKVIEINELGLGKEERGEEKSVPISSNAPFILHEEKSAGTVAGGRKSILKSIAIPLGFFKSKNQLSSQPAKPIRVEIEIPKSEKRVVNYSELRSSLSPFENQDFINIGSINEQKTSAIIPEIPKPVEPAPAPKIPEKPAAPEEKSEILGTIKKPEPKIEGNTIDLSPIK